ncbi:cytochrome P450 [Peredibacter starrii]
MKNPVLFLDECFTEGLQDIQTVRIGPKIFHLIFDPDLAQKILISESEVFVQNRSIFDRIKPITGDKGLVQLNGDESRLNRRKVRPMLLPSNMEEMKKIVLKNTNEAIENLRPGSFIDISDFMADLVLRNAFGMFLGIDIKQGAQDIVSEYKTLNQLCGNRMVSMLPLPLIIPTPTNLLIRRLRKSLRSKIQNTLKNKLPTTTNVHKIFFEDETLIDQCMTFLFAGHETTASSLAFTFLLLANHPQYMRQIKEGDEEIAHHVYMEALRLFPPAYMLAREASKGTNLNGVKINKGDQVLIGIKQIHHHPKFHSNPGTFSPERFQANVKSFLPFGLGPKNCIGEKVAYMEAEIIIKCFCERVQFGIFDSQIEYRPLVTLHPKSNQLLKIRDVIYGQ